MRSIPLQMRSLVRANVGAVLSLCVLLAAGGIPRSARSDCALLPIKAAEFPSYSSSGDPSFVFPPIAAPGEPVTVRAGLECTPQSGFDPDPAKNVVQLRFVPRSGIVTEVAVDPSHVAVENCGGGILGAGVRCDVLRFTIPDTDALVGDPDDDLTLTGPAEIVVTHADSPGEQLAFIGSLFQPTTACALAEQAAETVFGHFTVLPQPTSFEGLATSARATLDGLGNLLIPFDWTPVLDAGAGATARVVQGRAALRDAQGDPIVVPNSPFDWFRSFVDGRPVPPLIEEFTDANGVTRILGTVDFPRSVLRLSRTGIGESGGEVSIYEVDDLAVLQVAGKGPIPIEEGLELRQLSAIPLNSLNAATDVAAVTADESLQALGSGLLAMAGVPGDENGDGDTLDLVAQVIQVSTASFTNTEDAVAVTPTVPPRPILGAGGEAPAFAAFCRSEADDGDEDGNGDGDTDDALFTAYAADGTLLAATDATCDDRPFAGVRPLVVSGDYAFFRSFEGDSEPNGSGLVFERASAQGTLVRQGGDFVSSFDAAFLLAPGVEQVAGVDYSGATPAGSPGALHATAKHDAGATGGVLLNGQFVAQAGGTSFVANVPQGAFAFEDGTIDVGDRARVQGELALIGGTAPLPPGLGPTSFRMELVVTEVVPRRHRSPQSFRFEAEIDFFVGNPPAPSLNDDFDAVDTVLRVFDPGNPGLVPGLQVAASRGAAAAGRIAILTPEAEEDFAGNGDGDRNDQVAQVVDAVARSITNLGLAATDIALSERLACTCVSEIDQGDGGTDANADGDKADDVLFYWRLGTALPATNAGIACGKVGAIGDHCVFTVPEPEQGPSGGTDLNGDNDKLDDVLHLLDSRNGQIENVGQAAEEFVVGPPYEVEGEVAFWLVAFRTCEDAQNDGVFMGNEDGDSADCVAQLKKIPGPADDTSVPSLINTRIAAEICDLPGCDPFFEPYRVMGPTLSILGPEPDGFGTQASPICLAGSPPGACDYTGNGDGVQDVIHVFNALTGQRQVYVVDETTQDIAPFLAQLLGQNFLYYCAPEVVFGADVDEDGDIDTTEVCVYVADPDGDFTLESDVTGSGDTCSEDPNPDQTDIDGDGRGDGVCDPDTSTQPTPACDVDFDCTIEAEDVNQILADRGASVGPTDPRDPDRDGVVTVADADLCDARIGEFVCPILIESAPSSSGGSCGLLGLEGLLPVALLGLARRRRARRRGRARRAALGAALLGLALAGAWPAAPAGALSIGLQASPNPIHPGTTTIDVTLTVEGVRGADGEGNGLLRGYDIDITFDTGVLSITAGDIVFDLDPFGGDPGVVIEQSVAGGVAGLSIFVPRSLEDDEALRALQDDSFELAVLTFTVLSVEETFVGFGATTLTGLDHDDEVSGARAHTTSGVLITVVPEPRVSLLLGLGIAALARRRRRLA